MSKNNYIKIAQSITSTKLIKIESWDGYSTLVFIRTSGATGLYSIDGNWADSAKFTRLSGPLGKDHFNAYRERNGNIYVKTTTQSEPLTVTSVGSNHVFKFEESDKDVDSLIVFTMIGRIGWHRLVPDHPFFNHVKETVFQSSQVLYHLCLTLKILVFISDAICRV